MKPAITMRPKMAKIVTSAILPSRDARRTKRRFAGLVVVLWKERSIADSDGLAVVLRAFVGQGRGGGDLHVVAGGSPLAKDSGNAGDVKREVVGDFGTD